MSDHARRGTVLTALMAAMLGCVSSPDEVPPPRAEESDVALARFSRDDETRLDRNAEEPGPIARFNAPRRVRRRGGADGEGGALRPSDSPPELPSSRKTLRPILPYDPDPFPTNASAMEDPSGFALRSFFNALSRVSAQEPGARANVVHFGDSHTAADFLTGEVRRGLQRRFGDGGRGFLFPGRPFKYYYQRDVKHGGDGSWTAQLGLKMDAVEPLGLGGVRMSASSQNARVYLETCSSCDTNNRVSAFEIYYWKRPDSGWFQVMIDGRPHRVVDTRSGASASSPQGSTGYFRVDVPDGPHRLEVYPVEGTVDLFGVVMERETPGVSYDALGINGATAFMPARWSWQLAGEQLAHRDPDLIVAWYGTNESTRPDFRSYDYRAAFQRMLEKFRENAPRASCLVVGPPDRVVRAHKKCGPGELGFEGEPLTASEGCAWESPAILSEIIAVQRAVAYDAGCAFWDARRVMGGPGIMDLWASSTPPLAQPDRVHLTRDGYERLGNALLTDLMTEYDRFSSKNDRSTGRSTASRSR